MKTEGNATKAGAEWYDWWWKAHDTHVKYTKSGGYNSRDGAASRHMTKELLLIISKRQKAFARYNAGKLGWTQYKKI
jgi:hypothetical protein